jgi:hypothetical protein
MVVGANLVFAFEQFVHDDNNKAHSSPMSGDNIGTLIVLMSAC